MMITVARIDTQFIRKVNRRYLAIKGSTSDVGGRIFETSNRNTTNDSRMDMPRVTFSPKQSRISKKRDKRVVETDRPKQIMADKGKEVSMEISKSKRPS